MGVLACDACINIRLEGSYRLQSDVEESSYVSNHDD